MFTEPSNKLMGLPEAIGNLTALRMLWVHNNKLPTQQIALLRMKFEALAKLQGRRRPVNLLVGGQFPKLADEAAQAASSQ